MSPSKDDPRIRQLKSPITAHMLRSLDPRCQVVQWDSPLSDHDLRALSRFMEQYPNVTLRIYGHYAEQSTTLNFLKYFPFIKKFQVDVYNLESLEPLRYLPPTLELLVLGETKRRFHLDILRAFPHLRAIFLEGHQSSFEVISELGELERVNLRSMTLPDLSPLLSLPKLWWLTIKLGGTRNLSLLPQLRKLKYLELWLIRALTDISAIGGIQSLQYLFLQSLKQVKSLPDFSRLKSLRRLHLESMKGLTDLTPIANAPQLEELVIIDARQFQVADFEPLVGIKTLKHVSIGTGSLKRNTQVASLFGPKVSKTVAYDMEFQFN